MFAHLFNDRSTLSEPNSREKPAMRMRYSVEIWQIQFRLKVLNNIILLAILSNYISMPLSARKIFHGRHQVYALLGVKMTNIKGSPTSNQLVSTGRFLLLVVFFFLGVSRFGWAQEDRKTWLACDADRDCVIAESNCGCVLAINRKYKKFASRAGGEIDCLKSVCDDRVLDFRAICKDSVCNKVRTKIDSKFKS